MFAAVVNVDCRPVELPSAVTARHAVEFAGGRRHVALIRSIDRSDADDDSAGVCETLDGRYWIVGRIRLDGRGDLKRRLADSRGASHAGSGSDALLCLRAYAAWGDAFVDRLAGDFAFALWDDERRRLVCVRDQLGVRSLFHAEAGTMRVVADSLDWIIASLPVVRELDDTWIADFLAIGHCRDFDRTVYRHVRRLPPAHVLSIGGATAVLRRYWRLDVAEPLRLRDRRLYAERFLDLMSQSIADRLPPGRVGISMSGGLDSTTLAACTVAATRDPGRVVAECVHFERLMTDDEKHYSALAARHLGIELRLRPADDLGYDPQWRTRSIRLAEPSSSIVSVYPDSIVAAEQADIASVWFFGEGPDNALVFEREAYFSWLFRRGDWLRLGEAGLLYLLAKGADGWATTLGRHGRRPEPAARPHPLPPWLDRGLVERVGLQRRFDRSDDDREPCHPWHPRAIASFGDPIWQAMLGDMEIETAIGGPLWRHPFLDLRVLEFMLAVPPVPWARRKLLLRRSMQGRLPAAVLGRNKAPLAGSPLADPVRQHGLPRLSANRGLDRFVDRRALPEGAMADWELEGMIAVHALDHWLEQGVPEATNITAL